MEDIARLSLNTEEEEEDTPHRSKPATPFQVMDGHAPPTRSRRELLVRSNSALPWTSHTVIHGSVRRDGRRPGRSLTRESSKRREAPPAASGGSRLYLCIAAFVVGVVAFTASCFLTTDLSFLITKKELTCEEKRNMEFPLTELKKQLRKNLVGQNLAVESLLQNLESFTASKGERPLVLWLSGWEGSGKTLTINIIKSVLPKEYKVQTVLAQLLPDSADNLQQKAMTLVQGLDPCGTNLLVIDGWDGESRLPLAILDQFLKSLHLPEASPHDTTSTSKVVVVLSGTRGGREIWQHFLYLQEKEGVDRNYLENNFTDLSLRLQKTHFLIPVTKNVALVPFLPMDAAQIRSCVVREMLKMQREDVLIEEAALTRVTKEVLAHTEFVPGSDPLLAIHGCKRVSSILSLVLSGSLDDLLRL